MPRFYGTRNPMPTAIRANHAFLKSTESDGEELPIQKQLDNAFQEGWNAAKNSSYGQSATPKAVYALNGFVISGAGWIAVEFDEEGLPILTEAVVKALEATR